MSNNIMSLTDNLYEQMDRLLNATDPEEIKREAERSKAIEGVAQTILNANAMAFDILKFRSKHIDDSVTEYTAAKLLGSKDGN